MKISRASKRDVSWGLPAARLVSYMNMEKKYSSETSVHIRTMLRCSPEDINCITVFMFIIRISLAE
jgi:hypothetical protein